MLETVSDKCLKIKRTVGLWQVIMIRSFSSSFYFRPLFLLPLSIDLSLQVKDSMDFDNPALTTRRNLAWSSDSPILLQHFCIISQSYWNELLRERELKKKNTLHFSFFSLSFHSSSRYVLMIVSLVDKREQRRHRWEVQTIARRDNYHQRINKHNPLETLLWIDC